VPDTSFDDIPVNSSHFWFAKSLDPSGSVVHAIAGMVSITSRSLFAPAYGLLGAFPFCDVYGDADVFNDLSGVIENRMGCGGI
jgi:hypothetical protein